MSPRRNRFPFSTVVNLLDGFRPPVEPIDASGQWDLSWGVYSMGFGVLPAGSVRIRRRPATPDGISLNIDYQKALGGDLVHQVLGEIECRNDALSTPRNWKVHCATRGPEGDVVAGTEIEIEAECNESGVTLTGPTGRREIPLSGARSVNWGLFEAVQRLPKAETKPLDFTLLDNFDQPKPGHTLSFREMTDLVIQPKQPPKDDPKAPQAEIPESELLSLQVCGYDHVGRGVVPINYWIGDGGQLLFVIAGIEAYVLQAQDGKSIA
jgi:hypothetical protein